MDRELTRFQLQPNTPRNQSHPSGADAIGKISDMINHPKGARLIQVAMQRYKAAKYKTLSG
jgi:hypothetical protein